MIWKGSDDMLATEAHYTILFIGNSYTYYNNMPEEIFSGIAKAAGYDHMTIASITKGGRYLDADDECAVAIDRYLDEHTCDYVVLQEQSACPALTPERFYTVARSLSEKIRGAGAVPVFYNTWGRKDDHGILAQHGWTHEDMTRLLAKAYGHAARENNGILAPVGPAFSDIYRHHGDRIELYHTDSTHPSPAGSLLAAFTIFGAITGCDPTTIPYSGSLDSVEATLLKLAARGALASI